jgi:hypothetical protein
VVVACRNHRHMFDNHLARVQLVALSARRVSAHGVAGLARSCPGFFGFPRSDAALGRDSVAGRSGSYSTFVLPFGGPCRIGGRNDLHTRFHSWEARFDGDQLIVG